jgi:hypothetical protein
MRGKCIVGGKNKFTFGRGEEGVGYNFRTKIQTLGWSVFFSIMAMAEWNLAKLVEQKFLCTVIETIIHHFMGYFVAGGYLEPGHLHD